MDDVVDRFTRFIEGFRGNGNPMVKYEAKLAAMASIGAKGIVVDFSDLCSFDEELAHSLIDRPRDILVLLSAVALTKLRIREPEYADTLGGVIIRFRGLPTEASLRTIGGPEHIGKLIMVTGFLTHIAKPEPYLIRGVWTCDACGESIPIKQLHVQFEKSPKKCPSCKNRRGFTQDEYNSDYILSQTIVVQERPETLSSGQLPRPFKLVLHEDLVETVHPGDRVTATGILRLLRKNKGAGTLRTRGLELEVNNIDVTSRYMELLNITEAEEEAIRLLSQDPEIYEKIIASIAPSIKGRTLEKTGVGHSIFGGMPKQQVGVKLRCWINVLLIGDYGVGKSQILEFIKRVAPRSMIASGGKHASGVGLTASMVKIDGEYLLHPGALVLCDLGHVLIDEYDKISEENLGSLNRPMEQGDLPIAKGGITATLPARTAIIAAANPTLGRYNPYQTIAQNVSIPPANLSRFDLIFVTRDLPNREEDEAISRHMSALRRGVNLQRAPIEEKMLTKYIMVARRLDPVFPEELDDKMAKFYVNTRSVSLDAVDRGVAPIAISPRNQEAVIRLAQARARMHLRDTVSMEDLEGAIELMMASLHQIGIDPQTGELDIDVLYTGKPRGLQMQLQNVLGVIGEMERDSGSVRDDDLFDEMQGKHGIGRSEVMRLIGVLMKDGTIYCPRPGYYKRT